MATGDQIKDIGARDDFVEELMAPLLSLLSSSLFVDMNADYVVFSNQIYVHAATHICRDAGGYLTTLSDHRGAISSPSQALRDLLTVLINIIDRFPSAFSRNAASTVTTITQLATSLTSSSAAASSSSSFFVSSSSSSSSTVRDPYKLWQLVEQFRARCDRWLEAARQPKETKEIKARGVAYGAEAFWEMTLIPHLKNSKLRTPH
jgi:hypothetical protein